MRLFIAFDVSDDAKEYIRQIQKKLPDSKSNLTKEFHLTLRFLGECDENETKKIIDGLKKVKFNKFKAKTTELGVFPSEDFIRVVWIGLEPKDKIIELKNKIEKELNLTKDERFHPHITLARIKFVKNKQDYIKQLKSIKTKEIEFDVKSIKLYKSELTPKGAVHGALDEFK
ncbi:RNA 2',3'-cyclic phosphodiesterase [Candidatus Woesearchaeota archaeon]|nr:RNA 2',3'-cyclic phosphodiesterase [Candidatus Woesearchaeota archaeon]